MIVDTEFDPNGEWDSIVDDDNGYPRDYVRDGLIWTVEYR